MSIVDIPAIESMGSILIVHFSKSKGAICIMNLSGIIYIKYLPCIQEKNGYQPAIANKQMSLFLRFPDMANYKMIHVRIYTVKTCWE